jgi:hypothetical protein
MLAPVNLPGRVKVEGGAAIPAGVSISLGAMNAAVLANGDFLFSNVAVSSYIVTVKFPPAMPDAYVQSIKYQDEDVLNNKLILDGTPPVPLNIVINPAGGSIDGRVVNARGEVIPNATVLMIPDQAPPIRPNLYRTTFTNESGQFQFHALPPGDYFVYAWMDIEKNSWFSPTFLRNFESFRQSINISSGQKQQLDVTAAPTN